MSHTSGCSCSLWILTLLYTSTRFCGRAYLYTTTSPRTPLPGPSLQQVTLGLRDSVLLICRAPPGHSGILFTLYRVKEKVDSVENQDGIEEAHFTVRVDSGLDQQNLYCCLYKDHNGFYSAFSHYLTLDQQHAHAPPPVLSVVPESGMVKRGQSLSFYCSLPPLQPRSLSRHGPEPESFLLLKTVSVAVGKSIVSCPRATEMSQSKPQPGAFHLGPVTGGEGGSYSCLYQYSKEEGAVNSTTSNVVQITVTDLLPMPSLSLQYQAGLWHLLCMGSPAYPGAAFSLYRTGSQIPVSTHNAPMAHHHAAFQVPVQDGIARDYQCQYRVRLGTDWHTSDYSLPLAVYEGTVSSTSPESPGVDWPSVVGSLSTIVLFCFIVVLVVAVIYKKVQAASQEKKKREEAQFWTQLQSKDHVIDLRLSFNSQVSGTSCEEWSGSRSEANNEWAEESTPTEMASRPPLWNPLSTFSNQHF